MAADAGRLAGVRGVGEGSPLIIGVIVIQCGPHTFMIGAPKFGTFPNELASRRFPKIGDLKIFGSLLRKIRPISPPAQRVLTGAVNPRATAPETVASSPVGPRSRVP
jgi:hypothetical protein